MEYFAVVGTTIGIYIILALSLNVIVGEAGQPSIGHAAFLGIGAYTAAILDTRFAFPFWLDTLSAFVLTGVVGAALGAISLRLKEDFLAITTIGINFVVVAFFQYVDYFGGPLGVGGIHRPSLFGKPMGPVGYFILTTFFVIAVVLFTRYLHGSWLGYGLRAIRDDESAALSVGINVAGYKIVAFVISTALAGLGGSLYAHFMQFISPEDFRFVESVTILAMVVLGGRGSILGVVVGAILLGVAPEIFRPLSDYRLFVYGMILVILMRIQPSGLLGPGSHLRRWLFETRATKAVRGSA